jgi:hypothetical protein
VLVGEIRLRLPITEKYQIIYFPKWLMNLNMNLLALNKNIDLCVDIA